MKVQGMFRNGLLLGGVIAALWFPIMPARAEQITYTGANKAVAIQDLEEERQIEDVTGLDEEFKALEDESVFIVEEVERYRRDEKRKKIQMVIVAATTIVIFGVGITTGIQGKKKNDPERPVEEKIETKEITGGQI